MLPLRQMILYLRAMALVFMKMILPSKRMALLLKKIIPLQRRAKIQSKCKSTRTGRRLKDMQLGMILQTSSSFNSRWPSLWRLSDKRKYPLRKRWLRFCWIEGTNYGQGSTLRSPSGLDTAQW
jgi:hypothetical protein